MSIESKYPKYYSMGDVYKNQQALVGTVIKFDCGDQRCVGVFKTIKPWILDASWLITVDPHYWIAGKNVERAINDSPNFQIGSRFNDGATVLAPNFKAWDQKLGLADPESSPISPPKRRSSGGEFSPVAAMWPDASAVFRRRTSTGDLSRSDLQRNSSIK